jgi:hypothetical protein
MAQYATCHCGARWTQHGNASGHCSRCHLTFSSLAGFDRHLRGLQHLNPAEMTTSTGEPLYVAESGGAQVGNGVIWRLLPTPAQRKSLERLKELTR